VKEEQLEAKCKNRPKIKGVKDLHGLGYLVLIIYFLLRTKSN
jgi:hypothetical protein